MNMTLREAAGTLNRGRRVYNIGFDVVDETQFTAYGIRDLEECWEGFCEDEGIEKDSVDYVTEAPKLAPKTAKNRKGRTENKSA